MRWASLRSFFRCRWCGSWCATGRSSIRPSTPTEIDLAHSGAIENNDDAPGRILKGVSSVWRNHRFWLMVLAISCNAIFFWGWSIWLPTYLRTARNFAFSTSGYLTFVIYGFAVVTILVIGRVSDQRVPPRAVCRARVGPRPRCS